VTDVLVVEAVADPKPAADQVLVDVRMAGVVYGDVIVRSGRYPLPLPGFPASRSAGRSWRSGRCGRSLLGRMVVATTAGQAGGYANEQ